MADNKDPSESNPLMDVESTPKAYKPSTKIVSSPLVRVLAAVFVSIAWMIVSSWLIIVNKYIMVDFGFKYPMFVSGMGMFVSGLASFFCCRVFNIVEAKNVVTRPFFISRIMPVGFFMALTLYTGNQVYLYLTVSFIQMLKAFTPVITMIALFIAQLEQPSYGMILAVALTAVGTAIASYGEANLSMIGMLFMLCSETAESIRLVMTQFLLVGMKFHPIEGLMYLAPACCFWLLIGSLTHELPTILEKGSFQIMADHPVYFIMAAFMGFAVNSLAYTTIKLASSLTLKVLGTAKNALLVVFSVIFLSEQVGGMQALGYVVSLFGFGWYNQIKMTHIANKPADAPQKH